MLQVTVSAFPVWRRAARTLLAAQVPPPHVLWKDSQDAQAELFDGNDPVPANGGPRPRVPRQFVELAESAACHRDSNRWTLLYRVLFRITHGEPHLLKIEVDDDVRSLTLMARAVGSDINRMHSFVRFRRIEDESGEQYVAWYRPDHQIVERAAPFFAERFAAIRWAILTPDRSAYWDLEELRFGPGVSQQQAPDEDALEDLWRTYYRATFNPARVNPEQMTALMPKRFWAAMPETSEVPGLLANAGREVELMTAADPPSAEPFVPEGGTLDALRGAVQGCRGCELYKHATQAVFGEGPERVRLVLVGEQPGDEEDRAGRPFVGPAGQLLDRALGEAGVDRTTVYITNAVKHFKYTEPQGEGKRRIHQTPRGPEIAACRPWLEAEMARLKPELIVCLGATAAQAVLGRAVRVLAERGHLFPHHWARQVLVTVHPSAVLRARENRERDYGLFVEDLKKAAASLG